MSLEFDGTLESSWLPHYLPQWSSRAASAARVSFAPLVLRIDEDQPPWSPEYNGSIRVSNLQSGVRSGPVGSSSGQHPFRDDLVVREHQPEQRIYTPHFGRIEATVSAIDHPNCMVALWLIGFEDVAERSGELCVFEIFGRDVGDSTSIVGLGIHPFNDPALVDEFVRVEVAMDARMPHTYTADWRPDGISFLIDGELVHESSQSPDYPMQLMLNIYEFEPEPGGRYPREFRVESLTGISPAS